MQAWDGGISRCLRAAETGWFSGLKGACQLVEGDQADRSGWGGLSGKELGMIIVRMLVVAFLQGGSFRIPAWLLATRRLIGRFMVVVVAIVIVMMMVAGVSMAG